MKNKFKLFGIIALVAVIAIMTACHTEDNGGDDPTSITYTSYDASGNSYTLVITKDPNRAAYAPQSGDSYVLTVKNPAGATIANSSGTVTAISGSNFTLTPVSGSAITIGIGNDGAIDTITGSIPGTGGNSAITDPTVQSNNPNNGGGNTLIGTYSRTIDGAGDFTFTFSGNNVTISFQGDNVTTTYTINGNTITFVGVEENTIQTATLSADRNSFTVSGKTGGGEFLNGTWIKQSNSGGTTLIGTYVFTEDNVIQTITFSGSDWSMKIGGNEMSRGTYTVSGSTVTFTVTWASQDAIQYAGINVGDTITATISGNNLIIDGETWTKQ